ncbi:MAG: flagellar export chaperone FliS [Leptolyngbya sp. PLA1]|nr:flagellar export chaperone FliS [Leptolyngbya sp. PLA1]
MTTQSANTYLRTKVMTASPEELRLMLLDGAIKFARQGIEGLEANNAEKTFNGFSQCRDIVFELLNTIRDDIDPELAQNARGLYSYLYRLVVEARFEKDRAKAETLVKLLDFERETWVMLMQQLAAERGSPAAPGTPPTAAPRGEISLQA